MKNFNFTAAQGELYIEKVVQLPDNIKEIKPENERLIIGHSETNHHHYINRVEAKFYGTENPNICYLSVAGKYADLVHDRSFDTHETLRIPTGFYRVRKQQEYTPKGWQKVQD